MLDKAFEALKSYDWGQDPKVLSPIDQAIVATHDDPAGRKELESRLIAALQTKLSLDAMQVLCRKLMIVGTAASVPALEKLLSDEKLSHMARYALERNPSPEAAKALRDALPKVDGELKIGIISSLGARQDTQCVAALAELLSSSDPAIARSAAQGLGAIRTPEAGKALSQAKPSAEAKAAASDATLACAESLLAAGNNKEALAIYKTLAAADQPKHVKLAATRGMLACAGKK